MTEEVKDSVIQKTQKVLGKHITKPSLTPKLLKKPPFRFLHDIVTSVIKETAFLKGVFNEEEMVSENVKEREAKIAFLTKLTNALVAISGNEIDVKPGKIVAGLEPTKTNKLLQLLGNCLDKKLNSSEYVAKLNSESKVEKKKIVEKTKTSKDSVDSSRKTEKTSKSLKPKDKVSKISTDSIRKEIKTKINQKDKPKKVVKTKEEVEVIPKSNSATKINTPSNSEIILDQKVDINAEIFDEPKEVSLENQIIIDDVKEPDQPKSETPIPRESTAKIRPKSARIQPAIIQSTKNESKELNPPHSTTNLLRPPTVRPMSSRPGAPRLRPESALPTDQIIPLGNINLIVENFSNQDEEETVVIQSVQLPEDQPSVEDVLNIPQDKGHLVEQILEQINDVNDLELKNNKDEEKDLILNTHSRDATQKEIHQLQNLVQTLTKVANPLGKLMTYLHEDLDGMHSELMMWINMKKQAYAEIKKQKEQHNASNAALKQQLEDVEENIKKIEFEIAYVQSNILKNDHRIKQLLTR
ncbi:TRAF3-interacting protein 1 isoform X1 [Onthophagus taurus]|uniref:TRAF3-interacting protein 1 isoform X1 n=1 Tax=Onthophagus taurus TaxID=166361 RepID=UPI0039BDBA44